MKRLLLSMAVGAALVLISAGPSWAMGTTPGLFAPCPQIGQANGCNVVITLNSNGTVTITPTGQPAYDGTEDQLVGVINNSAGTVGAISLTGSGITGFDGDGAWSPGNACITFGANTYGCGTPSFNDFTFANVPGYQGPLTTYSGITATGLTVNFNSALNNVGPNNISYFSLEGPPTAGGFTVSHITVVPEPGTLMLLGTGLAGILARRRRKQA